MEEEPVKEQPSDGVSGNSARPKLLRYALRSSTKSKDHKPDASDRSISSESKSGRSTPSVSKSVSVIDFSGKDKSTSAKPPRRLSIPTKASVTPSTKVVGNITPISEARTRRSGNGQGPQSRTQTPTSDISRTSSRMKFNLLSSASYWLNQIKLSESSAKHSVSLGFFKLALEAGCEPFQKMQDELKSYVGRHQLAAELGEEVKELLESYNIEVNIEQSQLSGTISQMPELGAPSSDDEVHCYISSSTMAAGKVKPKCSNTDSTPTTPVTSDSTKKETRQKNTPASSRLRENLRMNSANSRHAFDSGNRRSVKKSEKPSKHETNKEKGKKSDVKEVLVNPTLAEDNVQGNKENMDVHTTDEISLTEEV